MVVRVVLLMLPMISLAAVVEERMQPVLLAAIQVAALAALVVTSVLFGGLVWVRQGSSRAVAVAVSAMQRLLV